MAFLKARSQWLVLDRRGKILRVFDTEDEAWKYHQRHPEAYERKERRYEQLAENPKICTPCGLKSAPWAKLAENQDTYGAVTGGLVLFGLLGVILWTASKEEPAASPAPTPAKKCPITSAQIIKFQTSSGYNVYVHDQTPQKMPVGYGDPKKERHFSAADCGFYKWDGSKWVQDHATNGAFLQSLKQQGVAGAPHPADVFMI